MNSTLPSEEVGAKIVEWHSCIIASSYKDAALLKKEVELMLEDMEENDKLLAYYSLIEYRHQTMINGNNGILTNEIQFNFKETSLDHYLKYLYYFVSGQYEFNKKRYRTAVKMFRKAERLLEHVQDDAEEAEFLSYIGYAYYRINQYLFSMSYLEQAETAFRRLNFVKKALNCKQVLGAIYSELENYDKAELCLKEILEESTYPSINGITLRALGLNMFAQSNYESAVKYFKQSLEVKEHKKSYYGMASLADLSHSLFKLNDVAAALEVFKKAKEGALYHKDSEFISRCKFIEGAYIKKDTSVIDEAINELNSEGLYYEVCELAAEMVEISEEKGDNESALKYSKLAYRGRVNQNLIGDGQE
ncbi:Rap family tetratricopeptide repeat protein [Shouchella patagoniensis]|uniref:Rap family tetratricopeptide repeat protein n=1 Tax=Shouchella patagoniensis TaxID=228576 RepID=UPI000995D2EE|nr:Rap family tetratricopeptide repeat protein [Shouchella patagoniensis]